MLRSWLLVPADDEAKMGKAIGVGADALVLDLSSMPERKKANARANAVTFLASQSQQVVARRRFARWVRINPIGSPHWKEDLVAVMQAKPEGIVLPRALGPQHVQTLAAEIYELEQGGPAEHNSTRIVPQVGDVAEGALAIPGFAQDPHPRILGLSWDMSAFAASAGMIGTENDAVRAVRAQLLFTAKARGLMAIESASGVVKKQDVLEQAVKRARMTGFDAMMARHPAQVPVIEKLFTPTEGDLVAARNIVSAFELASEAQVLTVDGRAVDRIDLTRARRMLDEA